MGSQSTFSALLEAESAHTVVGLLQIGIAYAVGIALALAVCLVSLSVQRLGLWEAHDRPQPTSYGQFNPAITIHAAVFHKLPPLKAVR